MNRVATDLDVGLLAEHVTLFSPNNPDGRAVLFTHGYGANADGYSEFSEACSRLGATCLTVDLLSHGKSSGDREDLTIQDYVDGLSAAYDHLASQPKVDASRIGTMAGSFGAYLSVLLSAERPVESMLLRVPALYPDGLKDVPRRNFNTDDVLCMEPHVDNSALKTVRDFGGKVLLVSSGKDEIIMSSTIDAYAQAINNGEHIRMDGASHVLDISAREVFKGILLAWAAEL